MQKSVLYSTILLFVLMGCTKNGVETTPSIEIKSFSTSQVPVNFPLEIRLQFTDKQGDIDSLYIKKIRTNLLERPTQFDSLYYLLPEIPEKPKGEIKVTLDYNLALVSATTPPTQVGAPNDKEPDTLIFKMWIKDKADNTSDTIYSDKIVVERQ